MFSPLGCLAQYVVHGTKSFGQASLRQTGEVGGAAQRRREGDPNLACAGRVVGGFDAVQAAVCDFF